MRTFVIVVIIILAIIFLGGAVPIGNAPLFGHVDSILGTSALMKLHKGVFFLLYRGEESVESGVERTGAEIEGFQQTPLGLDKAEKHKKLQEAADN